MIEAMEDATFVSDGNGNTATIKKWGSREAALLSLKTLTDCKGCTDCFNCVNCENCFNCVNCVDCKECGACTDCSECENCTGCRECRTLKTCDECMNCEDSEGIQQCSQCTRCENSYNCIRCTGVGNSQNCVNCDNSYSIIECIRCRYCAHCESCVDCSYSVSLDNKYHEICKGGIRPTRLPEIPVIEDIDKKVYAAASVDGALSMTEWHECKTTHCRAGWVVHLAGEKGYALEKALRGSTLFAAMLIYKESGSPINPCRFFDSDEKALEEMAARVL